MKRTNFDRGILFLAAILSAVASSAQPSGKGRNSQPSTFPAIVTFESSPGTCVPANRSIQMDVPGSGYETADGEARVYINGLRNVIVDLGRFFDPTGDRSILVCSDDDEMSSIATACGGLPPMDFNWFSTNNRAIETPSGELIRDIEIPSAKKKKNPKRRSLTLFDMCTKKQYMVREDPEGDDLPPTRWKLDAAVTFEQYKSGHEDPSIWRIFAGFGANGLCEAPEPCPDRADVEFDVDVDSGEALWSISFTGEAFLHCKESFGANANVVENLSWPFTVEARCPTCELPPECVALNKDDEAVFVDRDP